MVLAFSLNHAFFNSLLINAQQIIPPTIHEEVCQSCAKYALIWVIDVMNFRIIILFVKLHVQGGFRLW